MHVPLYDIQAQNDALHDDLIAAVDRVVTNSQFVLGPEVEAFETEAAESLGVGHTIGVSSGTDALLMSLMSLGVGPGDRVIVPAFSFFATAGVVSRLHATPVFLDIDPETFNMDPDALTDWFTGNTELAPTVKAIIPVHLFGQCADMGAILDISENYGVPVVEDVAQAIGAGYPNPQETFAAGAMGYTGCFSFFPTKNLGGAGDGGMVTTQDADLAERLRRYRNHAMHPKYYHAETGGNFRLHAIQAAVLRVKLPYLQEWNAARRRNAEFYDAHLPADAAATPAPVHGREHHVYNQYTIRVPERREELQSYLQSEGIGCEVYYPVPLHVQPCFADLGDATGDFPETERACAEVLSLPVHPGLSEDQLTFVADRINAFFS